VLVQLTDTEYATPKAVHDALTAAEERLSKLERRVDKTVPQVKRSRSEESASLESSFESKAVRGMLCARICMYSLRCTPLFVENIW